MFCSSAEIYFFLPSQCVMDQTAEPHMYKSQAFSIAEHPSYKGLRTVFYLQRLQIVECPVLNGLDGVTVYHQQLQAFQI